MVEIILSVRPDRYGVQAMVMVVPVESGKQDFALIHTLVKNRVSIDVGVHDQVGRLGNDDTVVDHGYAEGRDQHLFLNEDM